MGLLFERSGSSEKIESGKESGVGVLKRVRVGN